MKRMVWLVAALAINATATPLTAQTPPAPTVIAPTPDSTAALKMRADSLIALFARAGSVTEVFDTSFLDHIPEPQFRKIATQLSDAFGKPLSVASLKPLSATAAAIVIRYEHGTADLNLAIAPTAPYRVVGLRITGAHIDAASIEDVLAQVQAIPGITGFALAKLGDGAPHLLQSLRPDGDLGIGSAFKLAILAELIRATNAGQRHWDDLVTLDGAPLPGGGYNKKPAGTRVSIRELAQQMISISDNSATDILLATLGRGPVEAMLPVIGWHDAARNRPFLSTLDLFKLKGVDHGALARKWATLDEAGRRALLDGTIAKLPLGAIDPHLFAAHKPVMIDMLEWYASPADLVRTLDWIRRNTATGAGAEARAILGINPGIAPQIAMRFGYVGYKGGSEPGVTALTYLVQTRRGAWYALATGANDTVNDVPEGRVIALAGRAVELLADRP